MKRKTILKILAGIVIFILVIKISVIAFVEPWISDKIEAALNEKNKDYIVEMRGVDILFFSKGIELKRIKLTSKREGGLNGEIRSIKAKGINLTALYNKDIDINELNISNASLTGHLSQKEEKEDKAEENGPILSPANISIGRFVFDEINVAISDTASSLAYSIKEGVFKIAGIQVKKQDTLSADMIREFEFDAKDLFFVTKDSLHTFNATGISYSTTSRIFSLKSFSIHPNFTDHAYTARFKYETDRIEATGSDVSIHGISALDYGKSGNIQSSYVEIGKMDLDVFRDKRKEFKHVNKPTFQELMYNYPHLLQIDSIALLSADVKYTEHAEEANEAGYITFKDIHAKIYNISNNPMYKTQKALITLKAETFLMGKGKLNILLTAPLFDPQNTFNVSGSLSALEASELNPILEKNAFVYVTAGKIDAMTFNFTANNTKSSGKLQMHYHDLDVAVKNKRTDDTTSVKEKLISMIANMVIINSNPLPGNALREGTIEFERDPEKFLFNYCAKSIMSGIKSSVVKAGRADKKAERAEKKADKKAEKTEKKADKKKDKKGKD